MLKNIPMLRKCGELLCWILDKIKEVVCFPAIVRKCNIAVVLSHVVICFLNLFFFNCYSFSVLAGQASSLTSMLLVGLFVRVENTYNKCTPNINNYFLKKNILRSFEAQILKTFMNIQPQIKNEKFL